MTLPVITEENSLLEIREIVLLNDSIFPLFFSGNEDVVRPDMTMSGQQIKSGVVLLGLKLAGVFEVDALLHEMCHLIDIDDQRANKPAWGLKHGKYMAFGRGSWWEKKTSQAVYRELRVGAFQFNLGAYFGFYEDFTKFSEDYANDLWNMPTDTVSIFLSEQGKIFSKDYFVIAVSDKLREMVNKPEYSFDAIQDEWERKMEVLRNNFALEETQNV